MKFSIDIDPKMEPIIAARLPGFYVDARGAYGIVFRDYYICCFINSDDGSYDVTVENNMKFSIDIDPKMEPIIAARLPGFYVDARGAYGIVFRDYYICCFINSDDGSYDVTVDTISDEGDFDKNIVWDSYDDPNEAIADLRYWLKAYRVMPLR